MNKAAAALAVAAFFLPAAQAQDEVLDPVALLPGLWGWHPDRLEAGEFGTCENSPLRIWFSEDGAQYYSEWVGDDLLSTGPILAHLPSTEGLAGFLIRYDDEDRLDPDGNPVSWWLVMTGEDQFIWIRQDWVGSGNSTAPMIRCDDSLIG